MKILHCADIHLDSSMTTNLDRSKAIQRRHELLITFIKMNEYAANNQVDMILIAGDLFDTEFITENTKEQVLASIIHNQQIQYVYIEGNHDEGVWIRNIRNVPKNFHYLMEGESYIFQDVEVIATQSPKNVTFQDKGFHVVMMHGEPDVKSYAGRGIHYMALGHLHRYQTITIDGRGIACYPGCLEGRGFDETGEKGFVILDSKRPEYIQFIPFASRKFLGIQVNIESCERQTEVIHQIENQLDNEDVTRNDLVKVYLIGHVQPELHINKGFVEQYFANKYFAFFIDEDRLKPWMDFSVYENDISLRGTFAKKVLGTNLTEEERFQILELGMQVLSGEEPD